MVHQTVIPTVNHYPLNQCIQSRLPPLKYKGTFNDAPPSFRPCGINPFRPSAAVPCRLKVVEALKQDRFIGCVQQYLASIPPINVLDNHMRPGPLPDSVPGFLIPTPSADQPQRNILSQEIDIDIAQPYDAEFIVKNNILPTMSYFHRAVNLAKTLGAHIATGISPLSNEELLQRITLESCEQSFHWKQSHIADNTKDRAMYRADAGKGVRPGDGRFGLQIFGREHSGFTWKLHSRVEDAAAAAVEQSEAKSKDRKGKGKARADCSKTRAKAHHQPKAPVEAAKEHPLPDGSLAPKFHVAFAPRWVLTTRDLQDMVTPRELNDPLKPKPNGVEEGETADTFLGKLTHYCIAHKIHLVAITNYELWTFGTFSLDWSTIQLTPLMSYTSCSPETAPLTDSTIDRTCHLATVPTWSISVMEAILFMMDSAKDIHEQPATFAAVVQSSQSSSVTAASTSLTPIQEEALAVPALSTRSRKRKAVEEPKPSTPAVVRDLLVREQKRSMAISGNFKPIPQELYIDPVHGSQDTRSIISASTTGSSDLALDRDDSEARRKRQRRDAPQPEAGPSKLSPAKKDAAAMNTRSKKRKVPEPEPVTQEVANERAIRRQKRSMAISGKVIRIPQELYPKPSNASEDAKSVGSIATCGTSNLGLDRDDSARRKRRRRGTESPSTDYTSATLQAEARSETSVDDLPDHASVSSCLSDVDVEQLEEPLPEPSTMPAIVVSSPPPSTVAAPAPPTVTPSPTVAPVAFTSTAAPPLSQTAYIKPPRSTRGVQRGGLVPMTIGMFRGFGPVGFARRDAIAVKYAKNTELIVERARMRAAGFEPPEGPEPEVVDLEADGTFRAAMAIATANANAE